MNSRMIVLNYEYFEHFISSSVQRDIYALGKAHMSSAPSLGIFPNVASAVRLTMALFHSCKENRQQRFLSTPLLQAIDGLITLALCLQVVSQAPQH